MTGPNDSDSATRPISVAELLAQNGTIGAPPVSGRRRRRRGNSNAVTVAELTGEIPIVRTGEIPIGTEPEPGPGPDTADDSTPGIDAGQAPIAVAPERAPEPKPRRGRAGSPERSYFPRPLRRRDRERSALPAAGAESMSPDPIDTAVDEALDTAVDEALDSAVDEAFDTAVDEAFDSAVDEALDEAGADSFASGQADAEATTADPTEAGIDQLGLTDIEYFGADDGALFGGDTLADEVARGGALDAERPAGVDHVDGAANLDEVGLGETFEGYQRPTRGRQILRGLVTVVQSVLAVFLGAGLFLAFGQLWQWNSVIAMVLAILVTLGLVAGVWVVRKTEDIASTLIAVGVGLLVTFGPLVLMQAG
jgi:hypothetical protein